jgi:hypothetical protein
MPGMATGSRVPLTTADIGCWVIKSATAPAGITRGWLGGERREIRRCLRPTYRVGLMVPGQRALLWLSGRQEPGVHAIGRLSSRPVLEPTTSVDVDLWLLTTPVPRDELRDAPALAAAEVLRMPAGSNPSYLSPSQMEGLLGHLDAAEVVRAGWG